MRNEFPYGQIHIKYDNCFEQNPSSQNPPEPENKEPPIAVGMTWSERLNIFFTSGILGLCVLAFYYAGDPLVSLIAKTPLAEYYASSSVVYMTVQIIYSLVTILVPFAIGGLFLQHIHKDRDIIPLNKPNSGKNLILALGIGFVALVISNYITTFFVLGAESFGVYFETGESKPVESVSDFFWQILGTAAVPALVEEFAVRGVVMQSLRKYGDVLAIAVSAVIFALLHGNMVQAPFALILGCIIGWLVIATDSLWTGIAIHFMNNAYAVVMSTLMEHIPEYMYMIVFLLINALGIVLGVMAFFKFDSRYKSTETFNEPGGNTFGARMSYRLQGILFVILSPPMTAAIIILIMQIADRIHFIGW